MAARSSQDSYLESWRLPSEIILLHLKLHSLLKPSMNKIYLIIILMLIHLSNVEAQSASQPQYSIGVVDTSQRFFFKTMQDFVKQNPAKGIKYGGLRKITAGVESVKIIRNGVIEYVKVNDLAYWAYFNEYGQLMRIYKGNTYYFLTLGTVCTYIKARDAQVTTDKAGKASLTYTTGQIGDYIDYISLGPEGELQEFSESNFAAATSKHPEIIEKYKNDKVDPTTTDRRGQKTFKIVKYATEFNGMK